MSSKWKKNRRAKFIMIESYVVKSPVWPELTANDKAVYLEIKWRYDGNNNGKIGLGAREAAAAIGKSSKDTGKRALDHLAQLGLIAKVKASGFSMKSRETAEWRLTEYVCNVTGELPTKDFMRWSKEASEKTTVRPQGHTVRPQGQWDLKREAANA
ncbi:hypothetical protein ABCW43_02385 [Neorhizobium sp. IRAMC:178]|uniref:hypothetical protein n=1 Tax=Neorhizobium tunisiense TaxID=3144793 RepID=UPI0031F703CD